MRKVAMNQSLQWRYATKKFDDQKEVAQETLHELLEALRLSPSSFGLQPWKFIVVKDKAIRQELRKFAWNQPQITDCSDLIVLCAKTSMDAAYIKDFIGRSAKANGIPVEALNAYQDLMLGFLQNQKPEEISNWMSRQVYIALGMLLSECARLKVDACPMEGFEAGQFDAILKLKEQGLHATVLCAVGYRASDDSYAQHAKVRFAQSEVIVVK